jgi:predicted dehydrogenase
MPRVRIAVVGAGLIGRKHIEVLRSHGTDYTLAAVADPGPAAAEEAQRLGYPWYPDFAEMLDRAKPDGAVVAVPNQFHVSTGLACVARNIPIMVEKPIADSIASALELVEEAEHKRVPVLVGHHRRHNPIMRKAAEIIRQGGIGKVVAATVFWLGHKPKEYFAVTWRRKVGGGPVLINAIHDIDCLRMLCGDVDTVQASTASIVRGPPVEDTAAAVLKFKSGALGTLIVSDTVSSPWSWEWTSRENSFFPYEPENCCLIAGTKGSLAIPSLQHRWHEPGAESWANPLTQLRVSVEAADPYYEQMRHFAGVIRGAEAPALSGIDGTRTLATTLAITESAKTCQPVRIEDMMTANLRPTQLGENSDD